MIDMVVHRHKLRETLSNLVGVFMNGKRAGRALPAKPKPIGYIKSMNGHAVDGDIVESLARGSGVVEPESIADDAKQPTRRGNARPEGPSPKRPATTKSPVQKDVR